MAARRLPLLWKTFHPVGILQFTKITFHQDNYYPAEAGEEEAESAD
jgi:hypothetical protein